MSDYKERMITEYKDLKERHEKLYRMIVKYEAGTLDFRPDCPIELLKKQETIMLRYLTILDIRAEIEKIDLEV